MKNLNRAFWSVVLTLVLAVNFAFASENNNNSPKRSQQPLDIKVLPWGPTQSDVDAAKLRVSQSAAVQNALKGTKNRLVAFEYVENSSASKSQPTPVPTHFRVIFYDYTNDRALIAENDFAGKETVTIREADFDPGVGGDELEAAFEMVKRDPKLGKLYNANHLEIYEAMPPVSNLNGERLVNIGFKNLETGENQVIGVSFKNAKLVYYENNAPPTARAEPDACGIPSAGQGSTGEGVAGQYQLSVSQGGSPLWEMLVIRPSSSSGRLGERSGLEIRDVKYKGKSLMKRGHVPVLNVQYVNNVCGPFRDWQYAEGYFQVPTEGTTYPNGPDGGIALVGEGQIATTSVETRNDMGNFRGVAIYNQDVGYGNEIVMVTEMNAGWYRYIMEWRFAPDGTIRPRYGFGSVTNSCVCSARTHHVYWRFDLDIVQPNNKIFKVERGRKFLTPISTEAAIFRKYQLNRGFLIQNSDGDEAYQITPGDSDGSVTNAAGVLTDTFGAGDFWLLRFKGTPGAPGELDDPNTSSAANFAPWVNNESLVNQDLVIWYGAHEYRFDDASRTKSSPDVLTGNHIVGPDLRAVRW